ncbi:MAG: nickel pincer cofactor biosynthesis protein LarC [Verrucomicrobiota bacterium]
MKTLYLDVFSGLSGDMFLGAMLDLGLELADLERELAKLGLNGYHLHAVRKQHSSITGTKFDVHLEEDHGHEHGAGHAQAHPHEHDHPHGHGDQHGDNHRHEHADGPGAGQRQAHEHEHDHEHDLSYGHEHRHGAEHEHGSHAQAGTHHRQHGEHRTFRDIRRLIEQSALSEWVKSKAVAVFERVAKAEGKIHGKPAEAVHFHEVGAIDSIVDIVGACVALEQLGRPRVLASRVTEGTGWINCAHGRFPVPAPATLEILAARRISVHQCDEPHELVTPTGAALLAEFAESFGPMSGLNVSKVGYGLGTRTNKTRPNVVRALLGEWLSAANDAAEGHDWERDTISVLETNLDDCSGEVLGYVVERALAAGALDVFHTPIQMKKNRPGVLLTVLCAPESADQFTAMLLRETSSFGVRRTTMERRKLKRESRSVQTPFGPVAVKLGMLDGQVVQASPEFESCKAVAKAANVPLSEVYRTAEQALRESGA